MTTSVTNARMTYEHQIIRYGTIQKDTHGINTF